MFQNFVFKNIHFICFLSFEFVGVEKWVKLVSMNCCTLAHGNVHTLIVLIYFSGFRAWWVISV